MGDEIEFGFVQIGDRRVYIEVLTEALREGLQDADREHAATLARAGTSVGVLYERGAALPSLGTFAPAAVTRLSKGEFETARDMEWPARLPEEEAVLRSILAGPDHVLGATGELTLEVTRAGDEPD